MSDDNAEPNGPLRRNGRKRRRIQGLGDEPQNKGSKRADSPGLLDSDPTGTALNSSQDGPLCKQCKSIDFDDLFKTRVRSKTEGSMLVIGLINKDIVRRGCILCRFLFQMRSAPDFEGGFHLRTHSTLDVHACETSGYRRADTVLSVEPGIRIQTLSIPTVSRIKSGFIVPESKKSTHARPDDLFYGGASVHPLEVNYEAIRSWLTKCQESHLETCERSSDGTSIPLICIDCNTRKLVPIAASDLYIALSYVWGSALISQNDNKSASSSDVRTLPATGIPQVVEDAIIVVRQLGLSYLWIDKYCIDQCDNDSRTHQIRHMDQVYEQAYATIIACAGKDATAGLPGVGSVARKPQPSINLHDKRLISTLPPLPSTLKGSVWASRGWTYQEFTLSRRCLFFTDRQVYFVCSAMTCCESIVSEQDDKTLVSTLEQGFLSAVIFGDTQSGPELRKFADHLRQYTGRDLTFESDALNAFRGVLSRSPFLSYYGIPIAPYDAPQFPMTRMEIYLGFARGLFWLPARNAWYYISQRRRSDFPSWSWTGWSGRIEYPGRYGPTDFHEGSFIKVDSDISKILFWVEDNTGNTIALDQLCESSVKNRPIVELSNYIQVEATTFLLRFQPGEGFRTTTRELLPIWICTCHLDTAHKGPLIRVDRWEDVILCQEPIEKDEYYQRLISQLWTCILLFVGVDDSTGYLYNLLVVDWKGDVAYRIGVITLVGSLEYLQQKLPFPRTRQRIRLG